MSCGVSDRTKGTDVLWNEVSTFIHIAMKWSASFVGLAALAHSASAHCARQNSLLVACRSTSFTSSDIWTTVVAGSTTSTAAIRQPVNNSPVTDVTSKDITCNINSAATETVTVAAGAFLGFKLDNTLYHQGPAAIYRRRIESSSSCTESNSDHSVGKVPSGSTAATWDGSGANWFKVSHGPAFLKKISSCARMTDCGVGCRFQPIFRFHRFQPERSEHYDSKYCSGRRGQSRTNVCTLSNVDGAISHSTLLALNKLVCTLQALRSGTSPARSSR